ncbi:transglycosylase SLT domain-containing protein [Halomonas urumqiensis]|uniref:Lytic transglycosylase n=1 Tax=Halomonas urumqiensis TaxID=1684789 RepID=A0A2N7UEQ1_9GAMM|nr:transglycosylase SLT domain-containing protein [Halomonas urumqiensis]PMR78865.1 lytic transglycosylase [Halomonas urumqiensis]PTB04229.1 LysM peptidoglycan-binding domain-containing protein [Halomonas urumqiensis]GHE19496.1 hypothetical protein GCM10017767_00170 [Halomonas urumqiensis]
MTYYTTRRRLLGFASAAALIGSLGVLGTATHAAGLATDSTRTYGSTSNTLPPAATPEPGFSQHFWDALALEPRDAWSRLRASFQWQDQEHNERVQHWIDHYRESPQNIVEITERARPWLAWITEKIEARDLPGEIALIPFIESSFDPTARSHRGAAGLWQFMPGTGDALGLHRHQGFDGRLDVVASTRAALDYIELQADQWYEGDIQLSLAAYNAGAGTVNRARNAAISRGESGDYWSLNLPSETMNYLPKLKAIAAIIDSPDEYQVALPDIEDAPAFAKIPVERPVSLSDVARLSGTSPTVLAELNPALTSGTAYPSRTTVLLVPAEHEERLMARLSNATERPSRTAANNTANDSYVVRRGDSLSGIASRQGVSVAEIREANGLSGTVIHAGQELTLPQRSLAAR